MSKAKGLVRTKTRDGSDATGETETPGRSESDLDVGPATPRSSKAAVLDSKRNMISRSSRTRSKSPSRRVSTDSSPGSLAGQKIRRNSVGSLASPLPLESESKEMNSVNDSEVAVVSTPRKKSKRRKSLGALDDVKAKARAKRSSSRSDLKELAKSPFKSPKSKKSNRASSVDDLMAHLGAPPATGEVVLSPNGTSRTTVDGTGRIRRVYSKKALNNDDGADSDGEHSRKSTGSKKSTKSARDRKGRKKDREARKNRKPASVSDLEIAHSATTAVDQKRDDNSADTKEQKPKKKNSKRDLLDGSVSSIRSEDSDKRTKLRKSISLDSPKSPKSPKPKKIASIDSSGHSRKGPALESISSHSTGSAKANTMRNSAHGNDGRRARKKTDTTYTDKPSRAKSVPIMPDEVKAAFSKKPPTLPPVHEPSKTDDEQQRLVDRIALLQTENDNAQAEVSKLRKELRDVKLESQRSQTERRELRADLREREFVIKESDMRIEALEKAVETQLDKIEDMEEELRRANEEIFMLEDKLNRMEDDFVDGGGDGVKKERDLAEQRQQRLERRLEEKEKELAEREDALREERRLLLKDDKAGRSVEQLEQDNRMLLKAMNREKTDAEDKLKEKDAEIEALKTEFRRSGMNGSTPLTGSGGDSDDQVALMEKEIKRLKEELDGLESGEVDKVKRELQAAKNEVQAMKSKYEGAQRRNLILEDEIDHWKSVNCNLEDELAEQKVQVAQWREKYESVVDVVDDDEDGRGQADTLHPLDSWQANTPASSVAMRRDDDLDEQTTNTISNLWSKLTTSQHQRGKPTGGTLPSGSLNEVIARSTFH